MSYIEETVIDANEHGSVVRFENGEGPEAVLAGFTLTNGYAVEGGGIYCIDSNPTLHHLRIIENKAYTCDEEDNFKGAAGGGIFLKNSNATLEHMTVSLNMSDLEGGGIYINKSNPILRQVAVYENTASNFGGGMYCTNSSPDLLQVEVTHNMTERGGGICLKNFSNTSLENVNIGHNIATTEGGAFSLDNSTVKLVNVTVTSNEAVSYGGGAYLNGGIIDLKNSIMWGDSPQELYFRSGGSSSSAKIEHSDLDGGLGGIENANSGDIDWREGNLDVDPLIHDSEATVFNYCLSGPVWYAGNVYSASPVIDKGDPSSQYNDAEDIWCIAVHPYLHWATQSEALNAQVVSLDSNTVRNDMGAFGGPNGNWDCVGGWRWHGGASNFSQDENGEEWTGCW